MVNIRRKLAALILAILSITGLGLVTAAPAQAFSTITYVAECPGNATYHQMVIVNQFSGARLTVFADYNGYWNYVPNGTGVYYSPIHYHDWIQYQFAGSGSLNFQYHVDCFYN